jgi:hypothetical protein
MAATADAQDTPASRASCARVTVTATVRAFAALTVLHQSHDLVVTNADIARGYVEVRAGSRIEVRNNSPAGYLLVFEGVGGESDVFAGITIEGLGSEVRIGPGGGWIPRSYAPGPAVMELSYRFALQRNASPGTYAWPLSISTRPL